LPLTDNIAINGTFDADIAGWDWLDLPTATGSCFYGFDLEYGNPPSATYVMCDTSGGYVSGHFFYQVIPVTPGLRYRFSGDWLGDLAGGSSDPCSTNNWAETIITFEASSDPCTWTWTNPGAVMYRKAWGVTSQNTEPGGMWDWQSIRTSLANGPADGIFTSTGNYMVVAFSLGGIESASMPWIDVDNIKVEGPGCPTPDLNGDCSLDFLDLRQFAADWLMCDRDPAGECWK
jgi:hypothetical protein